MFSVAGGTCLFSNREETVVHAFLECENVTRLLRSNECWIRRVIDRHFKLSDVDKIFGIFPINITVNTVNTIDQANRWHPYISAGEMQAL